MLQVKFDKVLDRLRHERSILQRRARILLVRGLARIGGSKLAGHAGSAKSVVVSLTTFPLRLAYVHLTIETLLRQREKPDRIVLWLSSSEIGPEDLPKPLIRQQQRGLDIRFVPDNYRSYKKLMYAASEWPEAVLVTADDDVLYPSYWLKKLLEVHRSDPESVVCYRGSIIEYDACSGKRLCYQSWSHQKCGNAATLRLFPIGVSGILYPPGSVTPEFLNPDQFLQLAPTGDDIWFKAMTLLQGRRCRRVLRESIHFPTIPGTQSQSLHRVNNLQQRNDEQIEAVFATFDLDSIARQEPLDLHENHGAN